MSIGTGGGPGPISLRANSVRNGSTLPATPVVGDVFELTSGSVGFYACSSAGVWTGPFGTGAGTIGGSTGSTDNRVLRSDGTGGSTLQNSAVTISDAGAITGATLAASAITSGTLAVARGGTGSGTYTKGDLLASPGGAALSSLPVGADGAVLTASSGTGTGLQWIAPTASITNNAPANTVTKSDGTNLVASQITDDGTLIRAGQSSAAANTYLEINTDEAAVNLNAGTGGQVNITRGDTTIAVLPDSISLTAATAVTVTTPVIKASATTDVTATPTVNTPAGIVRIAAAASTVTVTCAACTTSSIVIATVRTVDATLKSVVAVPGSGSFVLTGNAVATANTDIQVWVIIPA